MSHASKVPGMMLIFCSTSKRINTIASTQSHVLCIPPQMVSNEKVKT